MKLSYLPFILLVVPLAEIAGFIFIGQQIGIVLTLIMIVVTAIIGSILLRWRGLSLLASIQSDIAQRKMPTEKMFQGALMVVAGILLLTPGFITDALGFSLFIPPVQSALWHFIKSKINFINPVNGSFNFDKKPENLDIVDLNPNDYQERSDDSPWGENKN